MITSDSEETANLTGLELFKTLIDQELGVGDWLAIDQARVNAFADATGDHQWIHVDPERCRREGFAGPIAHGFLTLSLVPHLRRTLSGPTTTLKPKMTINYGCDRVRFVSPVRVGQRVRLRVTLMDLHEVSDGSWQIRYGYTVEIEGHAKPALVTEAIHRVAI